MPGLLGFVLAVVGMACCVAGLVELVYWMMMKWAWAVKAQLEARSRTAAVRMAEAVRGLNSEQIRLVQAARLKADYTPTALGPLSRFDYGEGRLVPTDFVLEFIEAGTDDLLLATSSYTDSIRREWANWVVDWLVAQGFALKPQGNIPAQWTDGGRAAALVAHGLVED
jgi:hypothetical protein